MTGTQKDDDAQTIVGTVGSLKISNRRLHFSLNLVLFSFRGFIA